MDFLSEPHVACCLLVDTSGSMNTQGKIDELNNALRNFKATVLEDPLSARRVDVCVISFATDVTVVNGGFCPIREFEPPTLMARGSTSMGAGIRYALEAVHEQVRNYHDQGVECFKPFILMITDGYPTDDVDDMEKLIAQRESEGRYGHLRFHAFGVKGADMDFLSRLTKRVLAVNNNAFDEIFRWTSETMKIISHSRTSDVVTGSDLTENLHVYDRETKKVPWED
ncbi:MAG: hypothetical protein K6A72_12080 [Lachnospiraceae bacterium]|nr:hypothetical protein [Lachnospiraceae bacterium]